MSQNRSRTGHAVYTDVMTVPPPDDRNPLVADGLLGFVFGEVWSRPGLSRRDRRFVTLPCVAAADAPGPLQEHVYAALRSGDVSLEEMRETVLHFAVYAGWPKASAFNMVVDTQWARLVAEGHLTDPPPPPLLPLPTSSDPDERLRDGEECFRRINCLSFAPPRDNPYTGAGILNFVFGEMWLRPGLGLRERRLITIACVAFQDADQPIRSHVYAALKSGDLSVAELEEVVLHFAAYYGHAKGQRLQDTLGERGGLRREG